MPTSKPRITVTLTEEQHAILRKISLAGGKSMSGIISEFMLMAQPALERMAVALQRLKQDTDADRQSVADMLSELHAEHGRKEVLALSPEASPAHDTPPPGTSHLYTRNGPGRHTVLRKRGLCPARCQHG